MMRLKKTPLCLEIEKLYREEGLDAKKCIEDYIKDRTNLTTPPNINIVDFFIDRYGVENTINITVKRDVIRKRLRRKTKNTMRNYNMRRDSATQLSRFNQERENPIEMIKAKDDGSRTDIDGAVFSIRAC